MTNLDEKTRAMWADVYRLRDKYASMGDTVEDWMKLFDEAFAIADKYGNSDEVIRMVLAVYTTLEVERGHVYG